MVSTTAFRETFVLILFGIVLVPIAAKRAQDAPGYWQTFSKELSSIAAYSGSPDTELCGANLALSLNDTIAYRPQRTPVAGRSIPNHARPKQDAASSVQRTPSSAPQTERAPLTIRFHVAASDQETGATTKSAPNEVAAATPAPRIIAATVAEPSTSEPPVIAKESEASKGRWTLIWMCSAIAAVAVFMSSC